MTVRVPPGPETRPTSDRVRGAIFSSLGARVTEARVLDLYAGTGALGLEALSRGAVGAVFVEHGRPALVALRANLAEYRRRDPRPITVTVEPRDVSVILLDLAEHNEQFDLIFADPPYGNEPQALLEAAALPQLLTATGELVLESGARDPLRMPDGWESTREAIYGDTRVTFLRRAAESPSTPCPAS